MYKSLLHLMGTSDNQMEWNIELNRILGLTYIHQHRYLFYPSCTYFTESNDVFYFVI